MYRKNRDPRREERLKIAGLNLWRLLGSVCGSGSAHKIQVARALSWGERGEARKKTRCLGHGNLDALSRLRSAWHHARATDDLPPTDARATHLHTEAMARGLFL